MAGSPSISTVLVLAALLSGCGTPQTSIEAPAAVSRAAPANVGRWDLLYVSNGAGTVSVYRYWHYSLYRILGGFRDPKGECVDKIGDVYITDAGSRKIFEYQHGGPKPIKVLRDPGYVPYGCSVNFNTGDLAVANNATTARGRGGIAIYRRAVGKPILFDPISGLYSPIACSYDDRGNLFVASLFHQSAYLYSSFAYKPKNSVSFKLVVLPYIGSSGPFDLVSGVQWDGAYWAVKYENAILRYSIDGQGTATYQGKTPLYNDTYSPGQFWITNFQGNPGKQGTQIVTVDQRYYSSGENLVQYWSYPSGGNSVASIASYLNQPYGVTVSLAPAK